MDLSIIITTRNRKEDLLRCIESVKNAELSGIDWELIIVDDNSDDGTEKILAENLGIKRCIIIRNQLQQMMVKSRNIGARHSSGKYILFIDDDNVVDSKMIKLLVDFTDNNKNYGIIGPTMHFLNTQKKYLDFQKVNFFSGKTKGMIDVNSKRIFSSDGIPNAFLIKKEVFDKCGYFDEGLIQTFTEPDFAFNAKKFGYECAIIKEAKIYHDVTSQDFLGPRALGGEFNQKAYCLMRNRSVIISRYGKWYQKFVYLVFFSWLWPLIYSLLILRSKKYYLIKFYWIGFRDGIVYFFTKRINNSLPKLIKS